MKKYKKGVYALAIVSAFTLATQASSAAHERSFDAAVRNAARQSTRGAALSLPLMVISL